MISTFVVSEVRFVAAGCVIDIDNGLLGYASCVLNGGLKIDGITVRRSAKGDLYAAFPARRDRRGGLRFLVHPINARTRREIESGILEALFAQGVLP